MARGERHFRPRYFLISHLSKTDSHPANPCTNLFCMSDRRDGLRLVDGDAAASSAQVDSSGVVSSGESELALLSAGKITLDEYIDMTVDRALSHLQGQISSARFEQMRQILRAELERDPDLDALVRRVAVGD